ncbi:MAG: polymer-forming cytoskeletal protein [Anaerovoracaceae bacterium]
MSNKGNFSQAMREILGLDSSQDKQKNSEELKTETQNTAAAGTEQSADRLNKDFSQSFNHDPSAGSAQSEQFNNTYNQETAEKAASGNEEPAFFDKPGYSGENQSTFTGNFKADSAKFTEDFKNTAGDGTGGQGFYEEEEVGTTIITRNTVIEGNIKSFENIELNGKVKGRIDTTKNVGVSGFVQGDIQATDILLEGAQIKGNINSKGALLMDKDTLLVGDVAAQNTRVDGKIKGEVNIGGNGEFLSNSVVVGNITVSNFYVQYGARMQGYINTNFSKNEEDSIFGQIAASN